LERTIIDLERRKAANLMQSSVAAFFSDATIRPTSTPDHCMTNVDSLLARIWAEHQRGNLRGAEASYRELLTKAPDNANAHVYLGIAQFDLKQFEQAVESYQRALYLRPFFPIAWNNLGNALRMIGRNSEADEAFQKALEQKPDYTNALKNRGTLWIWAGEVERGLQWYEKALALAPDDFELHRNLGVIFLLQGRYEEGWNEYRWRWKGPGMRRPAIPKPLWQGEPLSGKTIFLYPEQGVGDAIQFARVIPELRGQGAEVILGCEPKLVPLFSGLKGVGQIVPTGGQVSGIDYHASLIDIVDLSWRGEQSIDGSPYLNSSDVLIAYWKRLLDRYTGKRIGICWQGNPQYHADIYRSIPLSKFEPLFGIPGIDWISLQFGQGSEQRSESGFARKITALPDGIDSSGGAFLDTAAVLCNLDLLITVDTSVGHLAGALGVPTWLLLNKVPDWRWGQEGTTTPWYQNHRLWRQENAGNWDSVFHAIHAQLAAEQL
jgi:Flp pilus assembly protein TadD